MFSHRKGANLPYVDRGYFGSTDICHFSGRLTIAIISFSIEGFDFCIHSLHLFLVICSTAIKLTPSCSNRLCLPLWGTLVKTAVVFLREKANSTSSSMNISLLTWPDHCSGHLGKLPNDAENESFVSSSEEHHLRASILPFLNCNHKVYLFFCSPLLNVIRVWCLRLLSAFAG